MSEIDRDTRSAVSDSDADMASPHPSGETRQTLELAEEFATVEVVREELGTVRLRTVTEEFDDIVQAAVRSEQVEITRHRIDREVDAAPLPRTEGDVTIIPVVEERAVVVTRLFVTEEVHLRRKVTEEPTELPVSLRRQRVIVERVGPSGELLAAQPGDDDRAAV